MREDGRTVVASKHQALGRFGLTLWALGQCPGAHHKGAQQNSKNNANQQKFVMRNAQLAFDNSKKHCQEEDSGQLSL